MHITPVQKVKTGAFVIICVFLLLLILYIVGKQKKLFGDTITVYTHFKNIAGTKEGAYVRFAGINAGTVESIHLLNDTTVQLMLTIDKEVQRHLKANAVATIGNDGLMGDKLIVLHAGSGDSVYAPIKNGETLGSIDPLDVDKIMNNLSKVSANAETITTGLSSIVEKINNGEGSIGRLMTDDKLARKLEGTVTTLKTAAGNVNENMEAAKHNFLLRGYFRKKERKRIKDSTEAAQKIRDSIPKKKD